MCKLIHDKRKSSHFRLWTKDEVFAELYTIARKVYKDLNKGEKFERFIRFYIRDNINPNIDTLYSKKDSKRLMYYKRNRHTKYSAIIVYALILFIKKHGNGIEVKKLEELKYFYIYTDDKLREYRLALLGNELVDDNIVIFNMIDEYVNLYEIYKLEYKRLI